MVRLVSGIVLAAAAVGAILFLPIQALRVIAVGVAGLAVHEYLQIAGAKGVLARGVAIGATMLLCGCIASQIPIEPAILLLIALAWIALSVLGGRTLHDSAVDLVAPVYVGAPMGMLVMVQVLGGWRATLLLVALVVVSDSAQYYSGRMLGRHALAPAISPKKTVEGAVGGVVCGTLFTVIVGARLFPGAAPASLALLGLVVVVLGICGDLFESRLKRTAGMKDSSALIPGHGGILDRIDALLFAAPAFYVWVGSLA
jgi:phosphatidate cytidylyltransferase